jgi:hypothetical protein
MKSNVVVPERDNALNDDDGSAPGPVHEDPDFVQPKERHDIYGRKSTSKINVRFSRQQLCMRASRENPLAN